MSGSGSLVVWLSISSLFSAMDRVYKKPLAIVRLILYVQAFTIYIQEPPLGYIGLFSSSVASCLTVLLMKCGCQYTVGDFHSDNESSWLKINFEGGVNPRDHRDVKFIYK